MGMRIFVILRRGNFETEGWRQLIYVERVEGLKREAIGKERGLKGTVSVLIGKGRIWASYGRKSVLFGKRNDRGRYEGAMSCCR